MTYFVSKRKSTSEPFRIVYREVKTHTSKGYPLTYELRLSPRNSKPGKKQWQRPSG